MRSGAMALLVALLCLNSCTSIHYRSSGIIATSFSPKPRHINLVKVSGTKEFYLWGSLPKEHTVEIDKELKKAGLISAANITIEEFQTVQDKITSWLSFGLYIPRSYVIRGFGVKSDDRL